MPKKPTKSKGSLTVKLGPEYRKALEYYQANAPSHLSIVEQVRRGLIFYWMRQPLPHGITALDFVLPGFEPGDEEFGIVVEEEPGGNS
jgi:hypothetical protein